MNNPAMQEAIQTIYMWDTYEPDLVRLLQLVKENPDFFDDGVKGITPLRQVILKLEPLILEHMMKKL